MLVTSNGATAGSLISIAVYGSINAGKSSLINALLSRDECKVSAIGGKTKIATSYIANELGSKNTIYSVEGGGVKMVDTPGICEVNGDERAFIAIEAARRSHIVLFVVVGDLASHEHVALQELIEINKPVLLDFNQIDRFNQSQRNEIIFALRNKVEIDLGLENIIMTASAPVKRIYAVDEHGNESFIEKAGIPEIEALVLRINTLLKNERDQLLLLPEIIGEIEKNDLRRRKQRESGLEVITSYSINTALIVSLNPVPFLDIAAGIGGLGTLIYKLADIYGVALGASEIDSIAGALIIYAMSVLAVSCGSYLAGSALKLIPWIGTVTGAIVQAGSVGYTMWVLGLAVQEYLENDCQWQGGVDETLKRIISVVDKDAITARIVARIKSKLNSKMEGARTSDDIIDLAETDKLISYYESKYPFLNRNRSHPPAVVV